ncbi:MAG: putative glycoside hydrolase [Terriglobia bacterium]
MLTILGAALAFRGTAIPRAKKSPSAGALRPAPSHAPATPNNVVAAAPATLTRPSSIQNAKSKIQNPSHQPERVAVASSPLAAVLPPVPPGAALYTVQRGESIAAIAHHNLARTSFLLTRELEAAIRAANNNKQGAFFKPGEQVIIPDILAAPIVERPIKIPPQTEIRGLYLTGYTAGSESGLRVIRDWRAAGGNAIVFDLKDYDGLVNVPYQNPLAPTTNSGLIPDLPKFVHFLHSLGLHGIARVACFRDAYQAEHTPSLDVHSRATGKPWRENGKLAWLDPSVRAAQDYDIGLAKMAAEAGADEIQFDYVRFPAEGDQKDAKFAFESVHPEWTRSDVIADFLRRAYAELHPPGVLLSLDVFGVMAWQRDVDLAHTGQDIPAMAKHCDVLSPMIYPSHFYRMDGYALPGDAPDHFITASMDRFRQVTQGTHVVIRPWLQGFGWRTKTFSPDYVCEQINLAKANGGIGYLFWNARNDYRVLFSGIQELHAAPNRVFRVDKVEAHAEPASPRARHLKPGIRGPQQQRSSQ